MTYTYVINGQEYEVKTHYPEESAEYIAEDAAEDYHSNHDGWESSWPVKIEVFNGTRSLGVFEVEREMEPVFRATEDKGQMMAGRK